MSQTIDAVSALLLGHPWSMQGDDLGTLVVHDAAPAPTAQDVANYIANLPVTTNLSQRTQALNQLLSDPTANSKFVRAVLLVILDEINTIRGLLVPSQGARTANQMKTAIQAKLNSGAAD